MRLTFCLCVLIAGCTSPPTVKPVSSLEEIQGTWKLIEVTDPEGKGFETENIEIVIQDNKATSQEQPLRLEFTPENFLKLYISDKDGAEKEIGEVSVEITTVANPTQMIWMDRKNEKQVSLFQKK